MQGRSHGAAPEYSKTRERCIKAESEAKTVASIVTGVRHHTSIRKGRLQEALHLSQDEATC